MAEEERLTKAQRRARKRRAQRRAETDDSLWQRWRPKLAPAAGIAGALVVFGGAIWLAFAGGQQGLEDVVVLAGGEVDQARDAAGCSVVAQQPSGPATHLEQGAPAPPPALQPPTGSAHYQATHPVVPDGSDTQLDSVALGHNLEHGALVIWYDPARVEAATVGEMESWAAELNASGFVSTLAGASIFVSPFEDPGIGSGEAVAMRGWSLGVNCAGWDETAASSFVIEAYGARGGAPEGAPFPEGTLRYAEGDAPQPFAAATP